MNSCFYTSKLSAIFFVNFFEHHVLEKLNFVALCVLELFFILVLYELSIGKKKKLKNYNNLKQLFKPIQTKLSFPLSETNVSQMFSRYL